MGLTAQFCARSKISPKQSYVRPSAGGRAPRHTCSLFLVMEDVFHVLLDAGGGCGGHET
jgi:hypothetical protein